MGLTYNGLDKSWNYAPERTDLPYADKLNVWAKITKERRYQKDYSYDVSVPSDFTVSNDSPGKEYSLLGSVSLSPTKEEILSLPYGGTILYGDWTERQLGIVEQLDYAGRLYKNNQIENSRNTAKNNFYTSVQNIANATRQGSYDYLTAKQSIQNQKTNLTNAGLSDEEAQKVIDSMVGSTGSFRAFYSLERVTPWDPSVLPSNLSSTTRQRTDLTDKFNTYANGKKGYYLNETPQGRAAKAAWDKAVADDNLDILYRYGSAEAYAKQDYLNQVTDPTKTSADIQSIRASEARPLSPLVTDYTEKVFPDAMAQQTRDEVQSKILGLKGTKETGYELRSIPGELSKFVGSNVTASNLWNQAKSEVSLARLSGDATPGQWTKLANSLKVDKNFLTDQEQFASLLGRVATLSTADPADQKVIAENQALVDKIKELKGDTTFKDLTSYSPVINEAFNKSVQTSEQQQVKQFGELRQSVLKDTINALIYAKRQENNIALFKSSSVGQEISSLQQKFNNSLLGDLNVGGIMPAGQQQAFKSKLDLGLGDIFGTKNGLIYNWENWFNDTIEKKYAGSIDIPNDYVPASLRTASNGFVDKETISSWDKYDKADAALKLNPFDQAAQATLKSAPSSYVKPENRKTVKQSWLDYETQLKSSGYVDPQTVATWSKYDEAYQTLQEDPSNANAKAVYDQRPAEYIPPDKRMDKDVQFAKDFFSYYLKPRFDASQSIAEFQDYIDVTKDTQNPFQTQDRMDALRLAAQNSVSRWFNDLQKAGDSRFNSDYYFDPVGYLNEKGVGDPANPLLPRAAFVDYVNTDAGQDAIKQKDRVERDWDAAKRGDTTTDDYGNTIDWAQEAYNYGVDVNNKAAFAQLHYQLVGLRAPEKDENGNIVKDANGNPVIKGGGRGFDPAPDVYGPQVAKLYISQILTPYLIDKSNKIGTVFGQFVKPSDYVDEVLKAVALPENKDQWSQILQNYGVDPNASRDEIKNYLVDALSQDSTAGIKKSIGDFLTKNQNKLPTQSDVGVEYIQRETTPSGTVTEPSGVYAIFKKAGFSGSEQDFYTQFMPDASQEDISIINAAYTTSGKPTPLLPTVTGTGMEQIATMAQLFGDTDISEVLGTAGVTMPTGVKPSLFTQLITSGEEDVGIGDPFTSAANTFGTVSGTTTSQQDKMGITNPFDDIGINDPFSDSSDPFTSYSEPFSATKTSVIRPTIVSTANFFRSLPGSSSKSGFSSSLFDSFGGSFGF